LIIAIPCLGSRICCRQHDFQSVSFKHDDNHMQLLLGRMSKTSFSLGQLMDLYIHPPPSTSTAVGCIS
jgi:hypothetical protein